MKGIKEMDEFKQVSTSEEIEYIRAITYSYLIYRKTVFFVEELKERGLEKDIMVTHIMTNESTDVLIIAEDPEIVANHIKNRLGETDTVFNTEDCEDKDYFGYTSLMLLKEDEKTFLPRIINFFFKKEVNK